MGRDKAWLRFNDRPLIEHSLSIVREAGATEVLISARAEQDFSSLDYPVLLDLKPDGGPLGGIERALAVAANSLVLVLAVDLPMMKREFLCKLIKQCDSETGVIPFVQGQPEPLAAIYPTRAHSALTRLMTANKLAARAFAKACLQEQLVQKVEVTETEKACFANWNSPEDLPE